MPTLLFFPSLVRVWRSLALGSLALRMITLRLLLVCVPGVLLLQVSCRMPEGPAVPPVDDSATAYWALQVNHRAVTLSMHAPWDTVQLTATAVSASEDTLDASGAITRFVSMDSSTVRVSPEGFVTAKSPTAETRIIATLTVGRLTYMDTVRVKVVNDPSPKRLESLSIQPPPGDSAKIPFEFLGAFWSPSDYGYLNTYASDGSAMGEILVDWRTLDPQLASIDRSSGTLRFPEFAGYSLYIWQKIGTVRIVASSYAYGVARVDTLYLRLGHSLYPFVSIKSFSRSDGDGYEQYFEVPEYGRWEENNLLLVGVGAELWLLNMTNEAVDLVFDDTAHIEAINGEVGEPVNTRIEPQNQDGQNMFYVYRRFTAPGDYKFRDARTNVSRTIRVVDERIGAAAQRRWYPSRATGTQRGVTGTR